MDGLFIDMSWRLLAHGDRFMDVEMDGMQLAGDFFAQLISYHNAEQYNECAFLHQLVIFTALALRLAFTVSGAQGSIPPRSCPSAGGAPSRQAPCHPAHPKRELKMAVRALA
jgi:hypothetical protein